MRFTTGPAPAFVCQPLLVEFTNTYAPVDAPPTPVWLTTIPVLLIRELPSLMIKYGLVISVTVLFTYTRFPATLTVSPGPPMLTVVAPPPTVPMLTV